MTNMDCWDVTVCGQGGRYRHKVPPTHWYPLLNYTASHPKRPHPLLLTAKKFWNLMFYVYCLKKRNRFLSHLFYLTSHFVETHATLRSWVHRVWRIVVPSYLLYPFCDPLTHLETLIQHSVTARHMQILCNSARRTSVLQTGNCWQRVYLQFDILWRDFHA